MNVAHRLQPVPFESLRNSTVRPDQFLDGPFSFCGYPTEFKRRNARAETSGGRDLVCARPSLQDEAEPTQYHSGPRRPELEPDIQTGHSAKPSPRGRLSA